MPCDPQYTTLAASSKLAASVTSSRGEAPREGKSSRGSPGLESLALDEIFRRVSWARAGRPVVPWFPLCRHSEAVSCSHSSDGKRGLGGRKGRASPRQEEHPLTKPRTPRQGSSLVKPRASSRAHANGAGPPRGPASSEPRQGLQRASRGAQRCYVIDHARRASHVLRQHGAAGCSRALPHAAEAPLLAPQRLKEADRKSVV